MATVAGRLTSGRSSPRTSSSPSKHLEPPKSRAKSGSPRRLEAGRTLPGNACGSAVINYHRASQAGRISPRGHGSLGKTRAKPTDPSVVGVGCETPGRANPCCDAGASEPRSSQQQQQQQQQQDVREEEQVRQLDASCEGPLVDEALGAQMDVAQAACENSLAQDDCIEAQGDLGDLTTGTQEIPEASSQDAQKPKESIEKSRPEPMDVESVGEGGSLLLSDTVLVAQPPQTPSKETVCTPQRQMEGRRQASPLQGKRQPSGSSTSRSTISPSRQLSTAPRQELAKQLKSREDEIAKLRQQLRKRTQECMRLRQQAAAGQLTVASGAPSEQVASNAGVPVEDIPSEAPEMPVATPESKGTTSSPRTVAHLQSGTPGEQAPSSIMSSPQCVEAPGSQPCTTPRTGSLTASYGPPRPLGTRVPQISQVQVAESPAVAQPTPLASTEPEDTCCSSRAMATCRESDRSVSADINESVVPSVESQGNSQGEEEKAPQGGSVTVGSTTVLTSQETLISTQPHSHGLTAAAMPGSSSGSCSSSGNAANASILHTSRGHPENHGSNAVPSAATNTPPQSYVLSRSLSALPPQVHPTEPRQQPVSVGWRGHPNQIAVVPVTRFSSIPASRLSLPRVPTGQQHGEPRRMVTSGAQLMTQPFKQTISALQTPHRPASPAPLYQWS